MNGPAINNGARQAITRQAKMRLISSLGLFAVLVSISTALLYHAANSRAVQEQSDDLAQYYRGRIIQLERGWEMRTHDIRERIEHTHQLESAETAIIPLQNFLAITEDERHIRYLQIEDNSGERIFTFGEGLNLATIPLPADSGSGFHFEPAGKELLRIVAEPIWLGKRGMGRIAIFYRIDHALLQELAAPGVTLTVFNAHQEIASSADEHGAASIQVPSGRSEERRSISWASGTSSPVTLAIRAPVSVPFSYIELAAAAGITLIIGGLILWFVMGNWLMRQAQRISSLGGAASEFAARRAFTHRLHQQINGAMSSANDELNDVADTLEEMAKLSEIHELELKQQEDQRRLWGMVFANSNEAILITDKDNRIIAVNPSFSLITGYSEKEVMGKNPSILASGMEDGGYYEEMWQKIVHNGHWEGQIHDRRKDGSIYPKWLTIVAIKDEQGEVINYVGTFVDITERKKNEARVNYLATHDALTGLPNRTLLIEQINKELATAARNVSILAVLVLDLDRFKLINDSLGHEHGDRLLRILAQRLLDSIHGGDTIARLGGDEFAILFNNIRDVSNISAIAGKIIEQISQPFILDNYEFHITASVGISLYPNDGSNAEQLLKHADAAMYSAKAAGKNQARFFDIGMNQNAMERFELENGLREALTSEQLELFFQPKLCLHGRVCGGAEALLRWQHPTLGSISPVRFIPIAEETGLINAIGEWVLHHTCRQIRAWHDAGIDPGIIAVNISAQQLESPNFADMVMRLMKEFRLEPDSLEFELTESAILQNPQQSIEILELLSKHGIHLSLDDFGTGYSSLSYLKRLPVDTVKIDRSFVNGLPHDEDDAQIVRMTVAMAKSIGLNVIAEGVENPAQLGYLKNVGCDLVQGYYISKPITAQQYETWLKEIGFTICTDHSRCSRKHCAPISRESMA